jgi:hypothetical protein
MNLTLKVWRQKNTSAAGEFVTCEARDVSPDMSFLEMLDVVNEGLIAKGEEPIAFDSDCREGICGAVFARDQWHSAWRAIAGRRPASFTCAIFTMAKRSRLSRGARNRFRFCATWWWIALRSIASSRPAVLFR